MNIKTALFVMLFVAGCGSNLTPSSSIVTAVKGHYSGAISHDGQHAVVGSIHHGASLWDIDKKARLFTWNHQSSEPVTATSCAFSYNNAFALTVEQYTLVLWDVKTGEGVRHWRTPSKVLDAKLSERGQYALLGLEDNRAVLFDVQNGGVIRELNHTGQVNSVSISTNGRTALTGSDDKSAIIWDLTSGEKKYAFKHDDSVILTLLSDDGTVAFTVSQYDKAALWNTHSGELLGELDLKSQSLKRGLRYTSAAMNHNNTQLLLGRPDQTVELWDVTSLKKLSSWKLPKRSKWKPTGASVQALAFKDKTTFMALASNGMLHSLELTQP